MRPSPRCFSRDSAPCASVRWRSPSHRRSPPCARSDPPFPRGAPSGALRASREHFAPTRATAEPWHMAPNGAEWRRDDQEVALSRSRGVYPPHQHLRPPRRGHLDLFVRLHRTGGWDQLRGDREVDRPGLPGDHEDPASRERRRGHAGGLPPPVVVHAPSGSGGRDGNRVLRFPRPARRA